MFDSYVRVARIYPALIISLPIIISSYCIFALCNVPIAIKISANSPIIIAVLVLLSNVVRHFGKEIEPKMLDKWNGAPSTRFLRKTDLHFAPETKKILYERLLKDTGVDLGTNNSDESIKQVFAIVRNKLRDKKSKGLWIKFNQEYGFLRNLTGSRFVWMVVAFISFVICLIIYFKSADRLDIFWICSLANFIVGIIAIVCGWGIFPRLLKGIAERYAEDALISYLNSD